MTDTHLTLLVVGDLHQGFGAVARIYYYVASWMKDFAFDAVVTTGDFSNYYRMNEHAFSQIHKATVNAMQEYLGLFGVPVLYVPGNHDLPKCEHPKGCLHCVDLLVGGKPYDLKGFRLVGIGGSWRLGGFPYEWDDTKEIEEGFCAKLPQDETPEILITHAPPIGCQVGFVETGEEVGSTAIRNVLLKRHPLVAICGHVHESSGWGTLGKTYIYNAGAVLSTSLLQGNNAPHGFGSSYLLKCWNRVSFTVLRISRDSEPHEVLHYFDDPSGWRVRCLILRDMRITPQSLPVAKG
jgi:Icc-related predicted phosphoesterase